MTAPADPPPAGPSPSPGFLRGVLFGWLTGFVVAWAVYAASNLLARPAYAAVTARDLAVQFGGGLEAFVMFTPFVAAPAGLVAGGAWLLRVPPPSGRAGWWAAFLAPVVGLALLPSVQ